MSRRSETFEKETAKRPEPNIYWRDISKDATVRLDRWCYIVDDKAVAFWHGQEAAEAQKHLDRLAT